MNDPVSTLQMFDGDHCSILGYALKVWSWCCYILAMGQTTAKCFNLTLRLTYVSASI